MPSKTVTWIGNASEDDGTSVLKLGTDGSGLTIELQAGVPTSLEEAFIRKIPLRHILVENAPAVNIKEKVSVSDFKSVNRGKAISNVLAR